MEQDNSATAVCWSVTRQVRTHGGAVLHIQGDDYGKRDQTLCGRRYYSGELYYFDVRDGLPDMFGDVLCKQCRSVYMRLPAALVARVGRAIAGAGREGL